MRVLVTALSSATQPDGVSRHAVNLSRALLDCTDLEHVDLILGEWQRPYIQSLLGNSTPKLHLHTVPISASSLDRNRWYYSQLPRLAAKLQSNIVHATYPIPVQRSHFSCPVVVTLHDLYPYDVPQNFGYPRVLLNRLILNQSLRAADAIACVSKSTMSRLAQHRPALMRKAFCIYNCLEPKRPIQSAPLNILKDQPFLLAVAQHRSNKNIPLTLSVFRRVLRHNPSLRLLIVGNEGPETAALQKLLAAEFLQPNVILLHGIPDEQLQWCYQHCELLLATSSVEGFGLPIVEAMLNGCPIVCSDIPPFREFGEGYCHFVDLKDNPELAFEKTIVDLLNRDHPQPALLSHLSAPVVAEACMRLYRDLLSAYAHSSKSLELERQKGISV